MNAGEDAQSVFDALTGSSIDADPLSRGHVLNLHFKRAVPDGAAQIILDALHASANEREAGK